jgi:pyruvate ferredoxin oxidoreductase delta subunit
MVKAMDEIGWRELEVGCVVLEPGNARGYRTGDWRTAGHPRVDVGRCVKCGQCYMFCPDIAIGRTAEGYYLPDLYYCKGCGICAHECPVKCIEMVSELEGEVRKG